MTKNRLSDLNNHLFAQLERLSDEDLKGEELAEEIDRSKSIERISRQIIENSRTSLKAAEFMSSIPRADAANALPESMRK